LTNGRFGDYQYHSGEVPVEARTESNAQGNVLGCGLLMDPDNKLATFFTLNGVLLGKFFLEVSSKYKYVVRFGKSNKKMSRIFIINLIICFYIMRNLKEKPIYRETNTNYSFGGCGSSFPYSHNLEKFGDIGGEFW
jgi:hypothetical protein